ncbi:MAG: hypothetical protein QXT19_01895 [Candidatus Woesearchaeota archaeon]
MRWVLAIVLVVLLLTGCREKEFVPITKGEQVIIKNKPPLPAVNEIIVSETAPFEETVYKPATETEPAVGKQPETSETVPYEPPAEAPPSIAKYQAMFRSNVKNYKFTYKNDKWFVSGKRAKMVPFRVLENIYHAPFVDTLYFDLENMTAVGVCEGRDAQIKRQCAQMGVLGKKYSLPYVQFKIPLPEDWLVEYQNLHMVVADSPKLASPVETVHLKHQTQTRRVDIYFDPAIGLPVAVIDNGIEYHYNLLSKNSLGFQESMVPE